MPSSATGSFTNATDYHNGLRDLFTGFAVTAPGAFTGRALSSVFR